MTTVANFEKDHAFTERARRLLDRDYYPGKAYMGRFVYVGGNSGGSQAIQRIAHADVVVQHAPGISHVYEEKIVRAKYAAFTLETHSNFERWGSEGATLTRKDGWIFTSEADYLLYAFTIEGGLEVWSLPMVRLREWFVPRETHFPFADVSNVDRSGRVAYTTRCRVVPIKDIPIQKEREVLAWAR